MDPFKEKLIQIYLPHCYATNNVIAYYWDRGNTDQVYNNIKMNNYTPTYDNWCLTCGQRGVNKRCNRCKSVFFCNEKCQKEAWPIHKTHCGRDLFSVCCVCGQKSGLTKCPNCPAKFCSPECKDRIWEPHAEIDCNNFKQIFGENGELGCPNQ